MNTKHHVSLYGKHAVTPSLHKATRDPFELGLPSDCHQLPEMLAPVSRGIWGITGYRGTLGVVSPQSFMRNMGIHTLPDGPLLSPAPE